MSDQLDRDAQSAIEDLTAQIRDFVLTSHAPFAVRANEIVQKHPDAFTRRQKKWLRIFLNVSLSPVGADLRCLSRLFATLARIRRPLAKRFFPVRQLGRLRYFIASRFWTAQSRTNALPSPLQDWIELAGLYLLLETTTAYEKLYGGEPEAVPGFLWAIRRTFRHVLERLSEANPDHRHLIMANYRMALARRHRNGSRENSARLQLARASQDLLSDGSESTVFLLSQLRLMYEKCLAGEFQTIESARSVIEEARRIVRKVGISKASLNLLYEIRLWGSEQYLAEDRSREAAVELRWCRYILRFMGLPAEQGKHRELDICARLGLLLMRCERPAEAREVLDRAIELIEERIQEFPNLTDRARLQSAYLRANRCMADGDREGVLTNLHTGLTILDHLSFVGGAPSAGESIRQTVSFSKLLMDFVRRPVETTIKMESRVDSASDQGELTEEKAEELRRLFEALKDIYSPEDALGSTIPAMWRRVTDEASVLCNPAQILSELFAQFFEFRHLADAHVDQTDWMALAKQGGEFLNQPGLEITAAQTNLLSAYMLLTSDHPDSGLELLTDGLQILQLCLDRKSFEIPFTTFHALDLYLSCVALDLAPKLKIRILDQLPLIDRLFTKLENVRATYILEDDRAPIERKLHHSYHRIAETLLSQLEGDLYPAQLQVQLAKQIVVYADRARLRWSLSVLSKASPPPEKPDQVPDHLWERYHTTRNELGLARGEITAFVDETDEVGLAPLQAFARASTLRRATRIAVAPKEDATLSPEIDSNPQLADYVGQCFRSYREAIQEIQFHVPNFEPDLAAIRHRPVADCFSDDHAQLHLPLIGDRLLVLYHSGVTRFTLIDAESTRALLDEIEPFERWLLAEAEPDSGETNPILQPSRPLLELAEEIQSILIPRPDEVAAGLRIFVDPSLGWLPIHVLHRPHDPGYLFEGYEVSYSPTLARRPRSILHETNTARIPVVFSSGSDLPGATLEGLAAWPSSQGKRLFANGQVTQANFSSSAENADIVHYCGHLLPDDDDPLDWVLASGGEGEISLRWCVNSLRFGRSQLVFLNACRSASTARGDSGRPIRSNRRMSMEDGLRLDPISFSTVFLITGASATISTLWDVDDLAAALFGWKFSKLFEERGSFTTLVECFTITVTWLREAIVSTRMLEEDILPQMLEDAGADQNLAPGDISMLHESVARLSRISSDKPPFSDPKYWAAFILSQQPGDG